MESIKPKQVRVLNREINTHYYLHVREDRMHRFYDFIMRNRNAGLPAIDFRQGVSAPAVTGLSAIFTTIPSKFPIIDILLWLREEQKTYLGSYPNPEINPQEIEAALGKFGQTVPLLRGDGSEIE